MRRVTKGSSTTSRPGGACAMAFCAIAVVMSAGVSVFADGRMISLSATAVQQGQPVRVASPACVREITVLVDGKLFPTTKNGSDIDLPTASLSPGTHVVAINCEGETSDPASFTVVGARQVETPTVLCARNASPRDGAAEALTTDARSLEDQTTKAEREKAQAARTSYPTPETTSRLLSRCDKDWAWTLRLEDRLSLDVAGFSDWYQVRENQQKPLHLFVDGIELGNMIARRVMTDPATKTDSLEVILTFDTDTAPADERAATRNALAQVLRTARAKSWNFGTSEMTVSVGPAGGPQWPGTAKIRINPYPTGLTWLGATGVLALVVLVLVLAVRTPLLRDSGGTTAPFSLAKNQMALWFVVIFSSFLFVTVTTGQAAAMSTTALTLIGISGATGLAAVAIDARKRVLESSERDALEAERTTLTKEIDGDGGLRSKRQSFADGSAEATQLDATIQLRRQRLEVVTKKLHEQPPASPKTSQGWLTDILSDENGISFHRVQMAGWTVAMVGVFVVAVWRTFAMAEFDATMLALLGISSGTYLGFKLPERDTKSEVPGK
jgi:hypothetical protein